ncbi:NADPH-dependent glutamate synthase [bacterium]
MSKRELIPERNPEKRVKDFEEVVLGYTKEQAIREAKRCLCCKDPLCNKGCPVDIDIPKFIKAIADGDFDDALEIMKSKNNLPAITGRVCPQETQCEQKCVLGLKKEAIAIGNLERFIADWGLKNKLATHKLANHTKRKKVAVIGSGPAGLTCAADCAKNGYDVTVFEALHAAGGVLRYGIPNFRLPTKILDTELDELKALGVKFKYNVAIGITLSIEDLKQKGFEAFFISTGAGVPYFLNIPNEDLDGIYSANEFLTRINLLNAHLFPKYDTPIKVGKKGVVIGGGNVAIDAARTLVRLGLDKVTIVYRRTIEEMPARIEEIRHAEEEGIEILTLTIPAYFIGDKNRELKRIKLQRMELDGLDDKGRKKVRPIDGDFFDKEVDTVIIAIGQNSNPILSQRTGIKIDNKNHIIVNNETMETSIKGIFAGGDVISGAATVISAMGAGKKAAFYIHQYLKH